MAKPRQGLYLQPLLESHNSSIFKSSVVQKARWFRSQSGLQAQKTGYSYSFNQNTQNESLFNGLVDMSFLKRPGEVLSKQDKFYSDLPTPNSLPSTTGLFFNPGNAYTIGIANALMYQNPIELWTEFNKAYSHDMEILRTLTRFQWSMIIRLLTNSRVSENSWNNMKFVVEAMMKLGHDIKSWEWIRIMGLAARDQDINGIQQIWNIIEQTGTDKTTALWNSYISQTAGTDAFRWFKNFDKRASPQKKPVNNAIGLVSKMIENNIQPNAATYELLMLHFAHFDDLSHTESLISSIWGVSLDPVDKKEGETTPTQGSLAYPTYYTLVAIINAFGSNGELVRGLQLMQEMQNKYKIDIGKKSKSLVLWKTMMKWAFLTLEPNGNTPAKTIDFIWDTMMNKYGLYPDSFIIRLRILHEISVRNYDQAAELLPMYIEQDGSESAKVHLAASLRKISKGYIKTGKFKECRALLEHWAPVNPLFQKAAEDLVRKNHQLS